MSRAWEQAAEWVVRLNDANVSEQDFVEWQTWLSKSTGHASAFQELQDTWYRSASVSRVTGSQPSSRSTAEVRSAPRLRTPRISRYAIAASVVLTIAAAAALTIVLREPSSKIETAVTELRFLTLADGTQVSVGPLTEVRIEFSERERRVVMNSGEAYFQVARVPGRPFTVRTANGRITALGTAFSMNVAEERLAVSVTEGAVRIEPPRPSVTARYSDSAPLDPLILRAGQKYIREAGKQATSTLASAADATAWQRGRLEYQGEPLRVVIADLNRYSRMKVKVEDPRLRDLRYTGTVFPEALDVWLRSIEGVFPLRVEYLAEERRLEPVD